ncbi:hypothetical protein GCM10009799_44300 [Nocardiopsis rhodophaea]|uniref:Uncharacterized protein n=1 Tax=Nocardiopsis rhodophaea TaxID=280238 RepID=A0ABN2TIX4_9ACTN
MDPSLVPELLELGAPVLAVLAASARLLAAASVLGFRLARYAYLVRGARVVEVPPLPEAALKHAAVFRSHTIGLLLVAPP